MLTSSNDPTFWWGRAVEVRAVAARMSDPLSRRTMLALAATYERLANRIGEQASRSRASAER